eukprot:1922010-Rhodomonas_salina.5
MSDAAGRFDYPGFGMSQQQAGLGSPCIPYVPHHQHRLGEIVRMCEKLLAMDADADVLAAAADT